MSVIACRYLDWSLLWRRFGSRARRVCRGALSATSHLYLLPPITFFSRPNMIKQQEILYLVALSITNDLQNHMLFQHDLTAASRSYTSHGFAMNSHAIFYLSRSTPLTSLTIVFHIIAFAASPSSLDSGVSTRHMLCSSKDRSTPWLTQYQASPATKPHWHPP